MNNKYWIMMQNGASIENHWLLVDSIQTEQGQRSDAQFRAWLREHGQEGELYILLAPVSGVTAIAERIVKDIKVNDELHSKGR